jgi:hypothetical protein
MRIQTKLLAALGLALALGGCAEWRQAGREIKETGKEVGHGVRDTAKDVGHGARDAAAGLGRATADAAREVREGVKDKDDDED